MEKINKADPRYAAAKKRIKEIKGFYVHLLVYMVINIFILVFNTQEIWTKDGVLEIENFFTLFFWGIGLFAHWATVFGPSLLFGKNWEEKKTKELLQKEKQQQQKWE